MPPECTALHETFQVKCNREYGHQGDHKRLEEGSSLTWPNKAAKTTYTKAQLVQMIGDHEVRLQQTLESVSGERSTLGDITKSFVPIMQTQLFLIKETLNRIKE